MQTWNDSDVKRMMAALGRTSTVLRTLGHKQSVRARQRAIAFYIAHNDAWGRVDGDELREWCKLLGCFNSANFAQNMTKECQRGLMTGNIRRDGGWQLTDAGSEYARRLADDIDRVTRELSTIGERISVRVCSIRCSLCSDTIRDEEHAYSCPDCGLHVHGECNQEMRQDGRSCPSGICPSRYSYQLLVERNASARVEVAVTADDEQDADNNTQAVA